MHKNMFIFLIAFAAVSCSTEYEFDGDIKEALEEDFTTTVYFIKDLNVTDLNSSSVFRRSYKMGKKYSSGDLPAFTDSDVWDMYPGYDLGGWKFAGIVDSNKNIELASAGNNSDAENFSETRITYDENGYVTGFSVPPQSICFYGDGYTVSSRTPYTIVLYKERLNPVSPYVYSPKEYDYFTTINARGTTNELTDAASLLQHLAGFEVPVLGTDFNEDYVNPNGSTAISVQYKRKTNISFTVADTVTSYTENYGPGVFEQPVTLQPSPARTGYTISSWTRTDSGGVASTVSSLPSVMPPENYTYNPIWQALSVQYTVNHKLQDTNLTTYTLDYSQTLYGETDSETNALPRSYSGFTAQTPVQANISGDGTTVVNVYYDRNSYTLNLYGNGGSNSMGSVHVSNPCIYGVETALPTNLFTRTGYSFEGWATTEARADAGTVDYAEVADYTIGAANASLYAVWRANQVSISIEVPDSGGVGITKTEAGNIITFTATLPDGADYGDYTYVWFDPNSGGIGSPACITYYYEIDKSTLATGTYQITLIATETLSGIPSGGTIQIDVE